MRIEDKLKLMQVASLFILVALLVTLLWNLFIIRDLKARVENRSTDRERIEEEEDTIIGLETQLEEAQEDLTALQVEVKQLQADLKAERDTTTMLREDLKKATKTYREATGQ